MNLVPETVDFFMGKSRCRGGLPRDGGGVSLRYYCLPPDVTMYVFEHEITTAIDFEVIM